MVDEKNYSILVVDDEDTIRRMIKRILLVKGYEVFEACDSDEALVFLKNQTVDLLITDYFMPGMNGLDLLIETSKLYPDMERIMITGLGEKDLYLEAINKGSIFSVIEKPILPEDLFDIVQRALDVHTARFNEQQELQHLKEQYHDFFDRTSNLIQCTDVSGNFIYVNPAWHKVMGYDKDELNTINFINLIHEDYREKLQDIIERIQIGEIAETFDAVMISKEGGFIYVEGAASTQGHMEGIVAVNYILRDITERRKAEEEVQIRLKQEIMIAQIAHLLAIAEEPAFVTSAILEIVGESAKVDRAYIYAVNEKKKMFSKIDTWCATPDAVDTQWEMTVPFSYLPWVYEKFQKESIFIYKHHENIPQPDIGFIKKHSIMSNLIFPIRTGITIVGILGFDIIREQRDWEDNEVAILRASVDIIANAWTRQQEIDYRKEKEREAEQSRLLVIRADRLAALGTMAAGIIHEIAQPLNAINVSAQTILYGMSRGWSKDESKIEKSLDLIVDQVKRMNEIITNMRGFARDGLTTIREKTNLNTLVKHVFEMLGEQMNAHGIDFRLDLGDIPDIEMNTQQILQVLLNLVTNARQALDETQTQDNIITIETSVQMDAYVILKVADNGPGIPFELHEKIFDPFFTTKDVGKGTGLGLSISSGIINDHNGVLDVETNESGGTTFIIKLPIMQPETETESS